MQIGQVSFSCSHGRTPSQSRVLSWNTWPQGLSVIILEPRVMSDWQMQHAWWSVFLTGQLLSFSSPGQTRLAALGSSFMKHAQCFWSMISLAIWSEVGISPVSEFSQQAAIALYTGLVRSSMPDWSKIKLYKEWFAFSFSSSSIQYCLMSNES